MKVVFDLDDTICVHERRDFENATPVMDTIDKMKALKKMGCFISIYTSRGQNSCDGDLGRIKKKYEKDVARWLKKNDVPFDELAFGKPLGDLYVDDKGVSLKEFHKMDIRKLNGNSGSKIYKAGELVVKNCKNSWEQYDWYKKASKYGINVPKIMSVVLDNITMEYIDGKIDDLTMPLFYKIMSNVFLFKQIHDGSRFDVEALIKRVNEHLDSKGVKHDFIKTKKCLLEGKSFLEKNASFSHGDLSISNCLLKEDSVYLIDPNQNGKYSSYLLDMAKLKFSVDGGELFLNEFEPANTKDVHDNYLSLLSDWGLLKIVTALEITHWIRLLKYEESEDGVRFIERKATELEGLL